MVIFIPILISNFVDVDFSYKIRDELLKYEDILNNQAVVK